VAHSYLFSANVAAADLLYARSINGFDSATTVIISVWAIIAFLLLPAGSFRYWTAAFIALLLLVGAGDHLPVRALLAGLLALHIVFAFPAAARSGQRRHLWMTLVSAVLLTGLVTTGGIRYWLPALIVAVLLVPFGVPLLWKRPRPRPARASFEVRFWPRGRLPGDPRGPVSAQHPSDSPTPPSNAQPSAASPAESSPAESSPAESSPAESSPAKGRRRHRPGLPTQGRPPRRPTPDETPPPASGDRPPAPSGEQRPTGLDRSGGRAATADNQPPAATGDTQPPASTGDNQPPAATGDNQPPASTGDNQPPAAGSDQPAGPASARNARSYPPGQRPGARPASQPRPQRRHKPPTSS
jgi:hypothetical protein